MAVKTKIDLSPAEAVALVRLAADHKEVATEMPAESSEQVDFMLRVYGGVSKAKDVSANIRKMPDGPEVVAWLFSKLSQDARIRLSTMFAEEIKGNRQLIAVANAAAARADAASKASLESPADADLAAMAEALRQEADACDRPERLFSVDPNSLLQARQMIDMAAIESKSPRSGATKAHLTIEAVDIASLKPAVLKQISESSRTIVFD